MIFINTQSPKAIFSYGENKEKRTIAKDWKIDTQGNKDLEKALEDSPAWGKANKEKAKEVEKVAPVVEKTETKPVTAKAE